MEIENGSGKVITPPLDPLAILSRAYYEVLFCCGQARMRDEAVEYLATVHHAFRYLQNTSGRGVQ